MALSPEDVIKKSFSATHLRRGYDETQVDDFLDEVVVELRRLHAENDGLRTDLEDCRAGRGISGDATGSSQPAGQVEATASSPEDAGSAAEIAELRRQLAECQEARAQAGARAEAGEGDMVPAGELEDLRGQVAAAEARTVELQEQLAAAQERAEAAERSSEELTAVSAAAEHTDGEEPSAIISLAQRLHDQHVAEGESTKVRLIEEGDSYKSQVVAEADERASELQRTGQETHDRLVNEGQTTHDELVRTGEQTRDQLVGEGRSNHDQMIGEAEQRRNEVLEDLNRKQTELGSRIQGLHTQESDLRDRLKTFLNDQLEKLDGSKG